MKKILILGVIYITTLLNANNNNLSPCNKIKMLQELLSKSKKPQIILLKMGEIAQSIDISLKEFKKNKAYKDICHLKIVKSSNFRDFASYDGYHYQQIVKKYPKSSVVDDAKYNLIYVITNNSYNFNNTCIEQKKLEKFIKDYPKSNKIKEAKKRVADIIKQGCTIVD